MEAVMSRSLLPILIVLGFTLPAVADELPTRKPGLWELKMAFEGGRMPVQSMQQCTDATTDKLMTNNFGNAGQGACSERHIKTSGSTITVDSVCSFGGAKVTTHAVVTGSFDSAYNVDVISHREGGRPLPHVAPGGKSHMTMNAKWLGPCARGQRPGDIIMPGGMSINVQDMQQRMRGGGPPRP
jgi:Protein of unknown function (DUF3617)